MGSTATDVRIRWITRKDLEQVEQLDQWGTGDRWTAVTFEHHLRHRHTIGMVLVEPSGDVGGYMVYRLERDAVYLLKLVVRRELWGNGHGLRLLRRFADKVRASRRPVARALVPEDNLGACCLLRAAGWRCVGRHDAETLAFEWLTCE